jgi:hypothetical protein
MNNKLAGGQSLTTGSRRFLKRCGAPGYQNNRALERGKSAQTPTSAVGTNRTSRANLLMSVPRGNPEVVGRSLN